MNSPAISCLGLCAATALLLGACSGTRQSMDLGPSDLSTPPHTLARAEYPFDAGGHYVDAWAAAGAARYPASMNTDEEREDRPTPRAKPPKPPLKKMASTKAAPSRPKSAAKKKPAAITVKSGDTLYSLSRKHGVSIDAIKRANGLPSDTLRDGRKLVIPK
ncbi:MAG: LysM peptidoglycan-binding domain-containing protein [Verrucomicrobiales bacterium]